MTEIEVSAKPATPTHALARHGFVIIRVFLEQFLDGCSRKAREGEAVAEKMELLFGFGFVGDEERNKQV